VEDVDYISCIFGSRGFRDEVVEDVDYIVRYLWNTGSSRRGSGGRGLHRPVSLEHWVFETWNTSSCIFETLRFRDEEWRTWNTSSCVFGSRGFRDEVVEDVDYIILYLWNTGFSRRGVEDVEYIILYLWIKGFSRRGSGGRGLHRPVSLEHWIFETR